MSVRWDFAIRQRKSSLEVPDAPDHLINASGLNKRARFFFNWCSLWFIKDLASWFSIIGFGPPLSQTTLSHLSTNDLVGGGILACSSAGFRQND
jgi:hypothetical protein